MKKVILSAICLVVVSGISRNVMASSSSKGTSTAEFLKLAVGGRAAAMGEAFTAVADDATALYWNPAALLQIPSKSFSIMHALYFDSSYFDYLGYGQKLGENGAVGAAYQYYTPGDIDKTDVTGANIGSFKPADQALSLGYAHRFNGWGAGLSLKSVKSKIVNSDSTLSADVGFLTPSYMEDKLKFGLTGRNLFGSLKYRTESEDLPSEYRLGSSYKISERWLTSADVAFPKTDEVYAAAGTEYVWGEKDRLQIAGRAGVNSKTMGDVDGFSGFGFGLGFLMKTFSIDYGIVPFGSVGIAHRISVNVNF